MRLPSLPTAHPARRRRNPDNNTMNEIICSITSAIEEGRSWGHTDKEIADYIYASISGPWRRSRRSSGTEGRVSEGFMLTTKSRNGENPLPGIMPRHGKPSPPTRA
ncbi:MAG: hypothetical protein ACLSAH_05120 [Bilophila wadsworthia]